MKETEDNYQQPIPGIVYQHYKGGLYEAMHVAIHTETKEKMVIYKSHTEGTIYARPLKDWYSKVTVSTKRPELYDMRADVAKDACLNTSCDSVETIRFIPFSSDNIH